MPRRGLLRIVYVPELWDDQRSSSHHPQLGSGDQLAEDPRGAKCARDWMEIPGWPPENIEELSKGLGPGLGATTKKFVETWVLSK